MLMMKIYCNIFLNNPLVRDLEQCKYIVAKNNHLSYLIKK